MLTLLAMVYTFVSPEGAVWDVPEDRDALADFAVGRLIDERYHLSNVDDLLDPSRGTKQLQNWVPLKKLRWLKQVTSDRNGTVTEVERAPQPMEPLPSA